MLFCIRGNKKYIHNGQFTFQRKRRRINCLIKKLTLCISSTHTLDTFLPESLWRLLFGSPKHYFQLGLLFCQLFQLGSGWPTNRHSCLWSPPSLQHHTYTSIQYLHTQSFLSFSKSQTISVFALSVLNSLKWVFYSWMMSRIVTYQLFSSYWFLKSNMQICLKRLCIKIYANLSCILFIASPAVSRYSSQQFTVK